MMKALSIKQYWLWAITDHGKRIENRTWKPPDYMIGKTIALHASARVDEGSLPAIYKILGKPIEAPMVRPIVSLGRIAAVARIKEVWEYEALTDLAHQARFDDVQAEAAEKLANPWFFGEFGWVLDQVRKLERPIACSGRLGLWDLPVYENDEVTAQLAELIRKERKS